MTRANRPLALLAFVAILAGCATTTVSDKHESANPGAAPSMIYVQNFDIGAATVQSDPGTLSGRPRLINLGRSDPASELRRLSDLLASSLVDDLRKAKFAATRLPDDAPRPAAGWIVTGDFVEVQEGNHLQKTVFGLGAGNSDTRLAVSIADAARATGDDLLNFTTDAQGDTAPSGAAVSVATHTPYMMAAKFVLNRDASEQDIKRTAAKIADQLTSFANAPNSK